MNHKLYIFHFFAKYKHMKIFNVMMDTLNDYVLIDILSLDKSVIKFLFTLSKRLQTIITKHDSLYNHIFPNDILKQAIENADVNLLKRLDILKLNKNYITRHYPKMHGNDCMYCSQRDETKSLQLLRFGMYWNHDVYRKYAFIENKFIDVGTSTTSETIVIYNIGLFDSIKCNHRDMIVSEPHKLCEMIRYNFQELYFVYPANCVTGCLTHILNNIINVFTINEEICDYYHVPHPLFLVQIHNPIKIHTCTKMRSDKQYSNFLIQIDFYKYIYIGVFPIEFETSFEVTDFILQKRVNVDNHPIPLARDKHYTYRLDMVEEDSEFMNYIKFSNDVFTLDMFNGEWHGNYIYLPHEEINVKMI